MQFTITIYVHVILIHWPGMNIYSSCISCSVNILPFNHLDEPNFQSILSGMQQNDASQDRLEDLHFDGFAIGETLHNW